MLGDVLVLGLGTSGVAAARYCAGLLGTEVDSVTAVDAADNERLRAIADDLAALGVRVALGCERVSGAYGVCIASPGIPPHSALMSSAREVCDLIISEVEFAFTRSRCPWAAVTGTNGKTTTTALLAHLLNSGGIPARAVGNIGTPAIEAVADADESEVLVAEVSSFQLALTRTFHPRVAVLLNVTPDHLDWHGSLDAYAEDKGRVFANLGPDDVAVIDVDDAGSGSFASEVAKRGVPVSRVSRTQGFPGGATVRDGVLRLETHAGEVVLCGADELQIKGPHNVSNALAAAAAAHALGVGGSDLTWGLRSFAPIEHRLEPAGQARGVEWFNDSKATNPDAVFKAVAAFQDRPFVILLGGRNKGADFGPLADEIAIRARAAVLFGESAPEFSRAFERTSMKPIVVPRLVDAVDTAARIAKPGEAVVLSPACASFDEFANYEERGRAFKDLVARLESGGEW